MLVLYQKFYSIAILKIKNFVVVLKICVRCFKNIVVYVLFGA